MAEARRYAATVVNEQVRREQATARIVDALTPDRTPAEVLGLTAVLSGDVEPVRLTTEGIVNALVEHGGYTREEAVERVTEHLADLPIVFDDGQPDVPTRDANGHKGP